MLKNNPFTTTKTYHPPLNPITVLTQHSQTALNQLYADSKYDNQAIGFHGKPANEEPKRYLLTKWERGALPKENFIDPFTSLHFAYSIYEVNTTKNTKHLIALFLILFILFIIVRYKK